MPGRQEVHSLQRRLDATFARVPASVDLELQADFARYLCVLVSGYLENALVALCLDLATRRSAPVIASFVERALDRWSNANSEKIAQLVGSFDPDWKRLADIYLVDERKEAVNSLIALRHKIAHGESVGTSIAQVRDYYIIIKQVVSFVADLVDPLPGVPRSSKVLHTQ